MIDGDHRQVGSDTTVETIADDSCGQGDSLVLQRRGSKYTTVPLLRSLLISDCIRYDMTVRWKTTSLMTSLTRAHSSSIVRKKTHPTNLPDSIHKEFKAVNRDNRVQIGIFRVVGFPRIVDRQDDLVQFI